MGHSLYHTGSIALVMNLATGLVSHQCRIVFDDKFATVPYFESATSPSFRADLCRSSTEYSIEEQENVYNEWYYPNVVSPSESNTTDTLVSDETT